MRSPASITNDRIRRCRRENDREGCVMRFCESCEVPIGVYSLSWYLREVGRSVCGVCGKPVRRTVLKQEVEWGTAEAASLLTGVSQERIRNMGVRGKIGRKLGRGQGLGYVYCIPDIERAA